MLHLMESIACEQNSGTRKQKNGTSTKVVEMPSARVHETE
jgi:hypothetical protein